MDIIVSLDIEALKARKASHDPNQMGFNFGAPAPTPAPAPAPHTGEPPAARGLHLETVQVGGAHPHQAHRWMSTDSAADGITAPEANRRSEHHFNLARAAGMHGGVGDDDTNREIVDLHDAASRAWRQAGHRLRSSAGPLDHEVAPAAIATALDVSREVNLRHSLAHRVLAEQHRAVGGEERAAAAKKHDEAAEAVERSDDDANVDVINANLVHKRTQPTAAHKEAVRATQEHVAGDNAESLVRRAVAAGADADSIRYFSAGGEGVLFRDKTGRVFKVGRLHGVRNGFGDGDILNPLQSEAEAGAALAEHGLAPRVHKYDKDHDVIVRDHVEGRHGSWADASKLWDHHQVKIAKTLRDAGFTRPEFKEDSYIFGADGSPKIVDVGFTNPMGKRLAAQLRAMEISPSSPRQFDIQTDVNNAVEDGALTYPEARDMLMRLKPEMQQHGMSILNDRAKRLGIPMGASPEAPATTPPAQGPKLDPNLATSAKVGDKVTLTTGGTAVTYTRTPSGWNEFGDAKDKRHANIDASHMAKLMGQHAGTHAPAAADAPPGAAPDAPALTEKQAFDLSHFGKYRAHTETHPSGLEIRVHHKPANTAGFSWSVHDPAPEGGRRAPVVSTSGAPAHSLDAALKKARRSANDTHAYRTKQRTAPEEMAHIAKLDDKISALQAATERLGGQTQRERDAAQHFPLGTGSMRPTGERGGSTKRAEQRMDASIDRAAAFVDTTRELQHAQAERAAYAAGQVNESGRSVHHAPKEAQPRRTITTDQKSRGVSKERAALEAAAWRKTHADYRGWHGDSPSIVHRGGLHKLGDLSDDDLRAIAPPTSGT